MFATPEELLDKIRLGEGTFLELKEVRFAGSKIRGPRRDDLADELAAFANSHGGVLVLGVDDSTRRILGIPEQHLPEVERFVHDMCHNLIKPPIAPIIDALRLPTTTGEVVPVIKIDVPRSLFVHRSPGSFLYRVGSSKRVMSPEYLVRLSQQRSQARIIRFDEQVVPQARLRDLEPVLWERFRTSRSRDAREAFLSKLHMVRLDDEGNLSPTVAGVLMASLNPREWLPNAYIQAVCYRGVDIRIDQATDPYQLDAADITGPLDRQVVEACRFVAKNMKVAAFKHMGRLDRPQFDMEAVFEAMINAVAHRDYSIHGSKIRLRLFSNRLELYSPGALPNTMAVEELAYLQSARNEIIASLLAKCRVPSAEAWLKTNRQTLMDKRGEGVPLIFSCSEALSGRLPEYRLIGREELMLTIWAPEE